MSFLSREMKLQRRSDRQLAGRVAPGLQSVSGGSKTNSVVSILMAIGVSLLAVSSFPDPVLGLSIFRNNKSSPPGEAGPRGAAFKEMTQKEKALAARKLRKMKGKRMTEEEQIEAQEKIWEQAVKHGARGIARATQMAHDTAAVAIADATAALRQKAMDQSALAAQIAAGITTTTTGAPLAPGPAPAPFPGVFPGPAPAPALVPGAALAPGAAPALAPGAAPSPAPAPGPGGAPAPGGPAPAPAR